MIRTKEGIMAGTSGWEQTFITLIFEMKKEKITFCLTDDNFEYENNNDDYCELEDDTLIGPSIMVNWNV